MTKRLALSVKCDEVIIIYKICVLTVFGFLFAKDCLAERKIVLMALIKDKAIVSIDGQRRLINVGKTSPEGVTLIAANSQQATVNVEGKSHTLTLGSGVSVYDSQTKNRKLEVLISKDSLGMFSTQATINGSNTVNALIDTGATAVAMNRQMAEKLHLNLSAGLQQTVDTAGGRANSQEITIDSIKVQAIELRNVKALIVDTQGMDNYILLGMSFLGRLKMINNPNHLVLELTESNKPR
jgi:aspartyl protease family protein